MNGWNRARFDDCCEIVGGATPSTSVASYWGGDICWATPKDLSDLDGALISDTPRKITQAGLDACAASVLPVGSVLFSSRAPIGHVAVNTVPMATNQGFKSFIPKPGRVHAKFLYWWLRSHRAYLEGLGNGATFKEVSKEVVARIEIKLPPLTEQRRIAEVLDRAEALRAKRRAALAQLDTLTQSIFLDLFGDPLVNDQNWPVHKVGELDLHIADGNYSSKYPTSAEFVESGVPFIRANNLRDLTVVGNDLRFISATKHQELKKGHLIEGDVLITTRGEIGNVAVVPRAFDGANINAQIVLLRPKGSQINSRYFAYLLNLPQMKVRFESYQNGVALKQLPIRLLVKVPLPVPPTDLQNEFARRVTAVEKMNATHRASLSELDALFAVLQYRAFRGEL